MITNHLIAKGIADSIATIYQSSTEADLNQAVIDNVLAVTMKFDSVKLEGSRNDPATYLTAYGDWFHSIMVRSFGNNLGRKRHLQPVSYAFVDFSASRGRSKINPGEMVRAGLLHLHAVIALRPGDGQACRLPFLVAGSAHRQRQFGDVKVTPFDPAQGSLENMIAYFKKGADAIGPFARSDCFDVFPRFRTRQRACPDVSGNGNIDVGRALGR
mgnify:CR=1 FL=1